MKRHRCAIYTRKSTEEGLEQEFNSLHAQREACEAYIRSQRHEGWSLVRDHYDDGGYSGGSMNRPALNKLLEAIKEGHIDIVVVYKVDRLTRSLADFARMVELFDRSGISFVSVTQQFNTTTSMGRLTLNVLLSFAQFEREVTGERIRDKITASKKKGMWMGGPVPLGYDVRDKRLIVNPHEAKTVKLLFSLYRDLGTVRLLERAARDRGLLSKQRGGVSGRPFTRGHLYQLLANPLYVGDVRHKAETHPGQHEAIIDRESWNEVENRLRSNRTADRSARNAKIGSLLSGLICDEAGDRLCPTHANKNGRRYRYYISQRLVHGAHRSDGGWRLPAREIESVVIGMIAELLNDPLRVMALFEIRDVPPDVINTATRNAATVADRLINADSQAQRGLLVSLAHKITLEAAAICIDIDRAGLSRLILESDRSSMASESTVRIEMPIALKRRGVEAKLVMRTEATDAAEPDRNLVILVAQAHRWLDLLVTGGADSVKQIAEREGQDPSDVGRILQLAFLAPDIIEAIMAGRQPIELIAKRLKRLGTLPTDWRLQRRILGFPG